jgi:hypothetical protein
MKTNKAPREGEVNELVTERREKSYGEHKTGSFI